MLFFDRQGVCSAFKDPGQVLYKIGYSSSSKGWLGDKPVYELLKSKVYSAMAENYGLKIC